MTHLGTRISALVDGQLSVAATERALAHVATCPQCADELAAARAARSRLASCADDVPPAPDLTARLLSLAPVPTDAPVPVAPRDPFAIPAGSALAAPGFPVHLGRGPSALRGDLTGRHGLSRRAIGSVAGLGALAAMLFVLGDRPAVVPAAQPGADLDLLGRAAASGTWSAGLLDTAVTQEKVDDLRESGWTVPESLPAGWTVTGTRWSGADADVLELDLVGPAGRLVVTEQVGRLDTAALVGAETIDVDGRVAYVLSYEPWHVAWQCGSTVVQVVAPRADDTAGELVAAFPDGAYDDGVPARLSRGWTTIARALDQP